MPFVPIDLTRSLNRMCVLSVRQANATTLVVHPPASPFLRLYTLISSGSDYDNDNGNVYVLYNVFSG